MLKRVVAAGALLLASANSANADGAYWNGTFVNNATVSVTVSLVTTQCWYPIDFGYNKLIEPGTTVSINSLIDASWPSCYYNSVFFLSYTMTPVGSSSVFASLNANDDQQVCFLTIPGPPLPASPCTPVLIRTPNPISYTVTISEIVPGVIGYGAVITQSNQ